MSPFSKVWEHHPVDGEHSRTCRGILCFSQPLSHFSFRASVFKRPSVSYTPISSSSSPHVSALVFLSLPRAPMAQESNPSLCPLLLMAATVPFGEGESCHQPLQAPRRPPQMKPCSPPLYHSPAASPIRWTTSLSFQASIPSDSSPAGHSSDPTAQREQLGIERNKCVTVSPADGVIKICQAAVCRCILAIQLFVLARFDHILRLC